MKNKMWGSLVSAGKKFRLQNKTVEFQRQKRLKKTKISFIMESELISFAAN
ncbi:MAG: hypothetical protein ACOC1D_01420 [Prolixibacteraceae bacterium]